MRACKLLVCVIPVSFLFINCFILLLRKHEIVYTKSVLIALSGYKWYIHSILNLCIVFFCFYPNVLLIYSYLYPVCKPQLSQHKIVNRKIALTVFNCENVIKIKHFFTVEIVLSCKHLSLLYVINLYCCI